MIQEDTVQEEIYKQTVELIQKNATPGYLPSNQHFEEIQYILQNIPKRYTGEIEVRIAKKEPIVLYYYINTEYAKNSDMLKFYKKISSILENLDAVTERNAWLSSDGERNPGIEIKLISE